MQLVVKKIIFLLASVVFTSEGFSQVPPNDNCSGAIVINNAKDFCSNVDQYTNVNATPSFVASGQDVWFSFVAVNFEVRITVSSQVARSYQIRLYGDCSAGIPGSSIQDGNTTIFNNSGLIPGNTYYFTVSSIGTSGAFKLCVENYQSTVKPGQDFPGATLICSTESIIREVNVTGAGSNVNEAAGTCLDVRPGIENSEKNSAWYRWTAANSGTLVFTITPNQFHDLDWVLYELGPEGNIQSPSATNKLRCAAGSGIGGTDCPQGPNEPAYSITGLDFNETDDEEASCSGKGQNGMLRIVTMKAGYVYALYVNNFSEGNNAFQLAFTDRSGKSGTGLFKGPTGKISHTVANPCSTQQSYTFSTNAKDFDTINWYFGAGASVTQWTSSSPPPDITYSSPGRKTVVMQLKNSLGCSVVETYSFMVELQPDPPAPIINKTTFCLTETIKFSTPEQIGVTYKWTGPGGFTSDLREPELTASSQTVAGTYTLIISRGDCSTSPVTLVIPPVLNKPTAAFRADPNVPAKLAFPVTVKFFNESTEGDTYLWDFGDGQTSSDMHPEHTYTGRGNFDVTLTVFKSTVCEASVTKGTFMIGEPGAIFIPNTFTPNNDSVNDEFAVNMNNIKTYRIQIFNRYGILMYSSADLVENWNGTYQNQPVPVGIYYYVLNAIDLDNNVIKKSGSVTILR